MKKRLQQILWGLAGLALIGGGAKAISAIVAQGFGVADFADNFQVTQAGDGPLGAYGVAIANDDSVYVTSHTDGYVYRFNTADSLPDSAVAQRRLNAVPIDGGLSGVVVTQDQRLYVARLGQGDVLELDRSTGAVLRTVASGLPCASHLAQDPVSQDLFLTSVCHDAVYRLSGFGSGPAVVGLYASLSGPDGLAFGPDGTLYVATLNGISAVQGTSAPNPGLATVLLSNQLSLNGLAAQAGAPGLQPYLYAAASDGTLWRYDPNIQGLAPTRVFFGAQRGEGLALSPGGCLYVTQSFGLAVVSHDDGSCLSGPQPTPTPTVTATATPTAPESPTITPTFSASLTVTDTPTFTETPTVTLTPTAIPTSAISLGPTVKVSTQGSGYVGLAASTTRLYATKGNDNHIYAIAPDGSESVFATLPVTWPEGYLTICPGLGGFPANHVFVTAGTAIYDVDLAGNATLFTTLPDNFGTHVGLVFDPYGSFGYDLLVAGGYSGEVWRVHPDGSYQKLAAPGGLLEGLDVAPLDFAPYGGWLFVPDESGSRIIAISPQGQVQVPANWPGAESVQFLYGHACAYSTTSMAFFVTESSGIFGYPQSDFANLGDRAIITGEFGAGIGLMESNGQTLSAGLLGDLNEHEGTAFVNCKVPSFPPAFDITSLTRPKLSLQNNGLFGVSGTVRRSDPGGYTLSVAKPSDPNGAVTVVAGTLDTPYADSYLGSVDLSSRPDGVYRLVLTSSDTGGRLDSDSTFVSKGKFWYQGEAQPSAVPLPWAAENSANGDLLLLPLNTAQLYETKPDGSFVAAYPIPSAATALACDGTRLFLAVPGQGVLRFPAPVASPNLESGGQAPLASDATLAAVPHPGALALAGGVLYVFDQAAGSIRAFDPATLAEKAVSGYGDGGLGAGTQLAVDPAGGELYVAHDQRVTVYSLGQGVPMRETGWPGQQAGGLAFDPGRDVLYLSRADLGRIDALDPSSGALLGSTEGYGSGEGQFQVAAGLGWTSAGSLLAGDSQLPRVQLFQGVIPKPTVRLTDPLFSLQNGGPFQVSGLIQGDPQPLLPNDAPAAWSLSLGPTGGALAPALSGQGGVNGALGSLDLSSAGQGVYQFQLTGTFSDGLGFQDTAYVSKGPFRYAGAQGLPAQSTAFMGVEASPGGDLLLADGAKPRLLELSAQGALVGVHPLGVSPAACLAVESGEVYVSVPGEGVVRRYPLPAAPGQPLGASDASVTGLSDPRGLAVAGGRLYVVERGAAQVRAYLLPGLTEAPGSPYSSNLNAGTLTDAAVDTANARLFVSYGSQVLMMDLSQGGILKILQASPSGQPVTGLCFDPARGLLYATVGAQSYGAVPVLEALDPDSGAVLDSVGSPGSAGGQFTAPGYPRWDAAGLLVVGDTGRVERFQSLVPRPRLSLDGPRLSLQNNGAFTVSGTASGDNGTGYPGDIASWSLSTLETAFNSQAVTVATGTGDVSGVLGSVDLSGFNSLPSVVQLIFSAVTTGGQGLQDSTFVSTGRFRYAGDWTSIPTAAYRCVAENPANGHLFVGLAGSGAVLELSATGAYVRQHPVPLSPTALACDGTYLYVATNSSVLKFALPSALGAPLGPQVGAAIGLVGPESLALSSGVLYVDTAANEVRAFDAASMVETAFSPIGADYLGLRFLSLVGLKLPGGGGDLAVNATASELYVLDVGRVVVYQLGTGHYLREFGLPLSVNGSACAWSSLGLDAAGDLYVGDPGNRVINAYNPSTGWNLGSYNWGVGGGFGRFAQLGGLRGAGANLLAVPDGGAAQLQWLQGVLPQPVVHIDSPRLPLVKTGLVSFSGSVQVAATPQLPGAALHQWQIGSFGGGFASGVLNVASGFLGSVDVSAWANAFYSVGLSATDQDGFSYGDSTVLSKGRFQYQASAPLNDGISGEPWICENPANGNYFVSVSTTVNQNSAQIKFVPTPVAVLAEFRADGTYVRRHGLPGPSLEVASGLASDGSSLFVARAGLGSVTRFPLPTSDGADLGPVADAATGLAQPRGLVLAGGRLYVAESGQVQVYSPSNLAAPLATLGRGYLDDGGALDVAVNTGLGELYVSDRNRVVVFDLAGNYLRQFAAPPGGRLDGLVWNPADSVLYASDAPLGQVEAYDPLLPHSGTLLATVHLDRPEGLRLSHSGQWLAEGSQSPVAQMMVPQVPKGYATIESPRLSLQNAGVFGVSGSLSVPDLGTWSLTLGKSVSPTAFQAVAGGSGSSTVSGGALGSPDLSGLPDGVYELLLQATDATGFNFTDHTFVSKGKFRFQEAFHHDGDDLGYDWAVQLPGPSGHLFVSLSGTATVLELDAAGNYVGRSDLSSQGGWLGGLALDPVHGLLYASFQDSGHVSAYPLPASPGAALGAASLDQGGFNVPRGLDLAGGWLYVAESGAQQVRVLNAATLQAIGPGVLGAGYLNRQGTLDVAVDASGTAYVSDAGRVVVYRADGHYQREFELPHTRIDSLALDAAGQVLYVADSWPSDASRQRVEAYAACTPNAGAYLGGTEGPGLSEGQFTTPWGLRFNDQGWLLAGDTAQPRVQAFEPFVARGAVMIEAPLLSLATAPESLSGTVQLSALSQYALSALEGWIVGLGKSRSGVALMTVAQGAANLTHAVLTSLDLSTQQDGVYEVALSATARDGTLYSDHTFVSKGLFRFAGAFQAPPYLGPTPTPTPGSNPYGGGGGGSFQPGDAPDFNQVPDFGPAYALAVERPCNGHLYVAYPSDKLLLELDGQGRYIGRYALPNTGVRGLAVEDHGGNGDLLYIAYAGANQVEARALPTACGEGLGATVNAWYASNAHGILLLGGTVYVASGNQVQVLSGPNPRPQGNFGSQHAVDLAGDPVRGELYVGDGTQVQVFSAATGSHLRNFPVDPQGAVNGMVFDPVHQMLYLANDDPSTPSLNGLLAYDPSSGSLVGRTEGFGQSEGQFLLPYGLRLTQAGLLLAGDMDLARLQLFAGFGLPTPTPSPMPSASPTPTVTGTRTATHTVTGTATPTATGTATATVSPSSTESASATPTMSPSVIATVSPTAAGTPVGLCVPGGLIADDDDLILEGGVKVDSYQSGEGPYGEGNRGSHGTVRAGRRVIRYGSSEVDGSVEADSPSGLGLVPPPADCRDLGNLNIGSDTTFEAGDYRVDQLNVNGDPVIRVKGTVRIWFKGINLAGTVGGGGALPSQLLLYALPDARTLNLNGDRTEFTGLVWAPNIPVNLNGSGDFYGACVGRRVKVHSRLAFHCDEDLERDCEGGHDGPRTATPTASFSATATMSPTLTQTPSGLCVPGGLIANEDDLILDGGVKVDSYRSGEGPYGEGNQGSHGTVRAGQQVIQNGGSEVDGSVEADSPSGLGLLPPPADCRDLGNLNIGSDTTFEAGDYRVDQLNVNGRPTIRVKGTVRIWFKGINLAGTVGGGGALPSQLQLYALPDARTLNLNGGPTEFTGLVWAPNIPVNLNGSGDFYGACVGRQVMVNSHLAFHCDQDLARGCEGGSGYDHWQNGGPESRELSLSRVFIKASPTPAAELAGPGGLRAVPNPAHDRAAVFYQLDQGAKVVFLLIDLTGRTVAVRDLGWQPAGTGRLDWDLRDDAPGLYWVVARIDTGVGPAATRIFKLAILGGRN